MSGASNYRPVLELTQRMRDAAQTQDWDALIRAESERRSVLGAMTARAPVFHGDSAVQHDDRETIMEIERIDKEIIEQVESWRNDVGMLIGIGRKQSA